MLPIWHLFVELTVCTGDFPGPNTIGFMNILLRAETATGAQQKLSAYFSDHGWSIVKVESARMIGLDFIAEDDDFADLVTRAHAHPDPIILGTLHSYKTN